MVYKNQEKELPNSYVNKIQQNYHWWSRQHSRGRGPGDQDGQGNCGGYGSPNDWKLGQGNYEHQHCTQHNGEHFWKECPVNLKSNTNKQVHGSYCGQVRNYDQGKSYQKLYHSKYLLTPPINHLSSPPVSSVTVDKSEKNYYA